MKLLLSACVLFGAIAAYSQTATGDDTMESQIRRGWSQRENLNVITLQAEQANEIRHGRISYNGILVQLVKTDNPLQLINPAAPVEYGSGQDNLLIDPKSGPGNSGKQGLKLFSINF